MYKIYIERAREKDIYRETTDKQEGTGKRVWVVISPSEPLIGSRLEPPLLEPPPLDSTLPRPWPLLLCTPLATLFRTTLTKAQSSWRMWAKCGRSVGEVWAKCGRRVDEGWAKCR